MDNYSKPLFSVSPDHQYRGPVTLFALPNSCGRSGRLDNHYWLIAIDYTKWLYPYFVDFQCCLLPTKGSSLGESWHMFPHSCKCFWKAHPEWCVFSGQRSFVSGKIARFVQFARMRVLYSLPTERHYGSVQSKPFAPTWGMGKIATDFVTETYRRHFEEKGAGRGSRWFCRRLLVDLPCKYFFLQIPARGAPLTRSHLPSVLSVLV